MAIFFEEVYEQHNVSYCRVIDAPFTCLNSVQVIILRNGNYLTGSKYFTVECNIFIYQMKSFNFNDE